MSLLRHETIRTTIPKAKELRRVVEPLITLGKDDSESNRRLAFSRLRDTEIVAKLFDTIGPRFKARPGGYTRILHMAPRPGDNAPMALMQLVERSAPVAVEAAPEDKKAKKVEASEGRQGREEGQGRSQEGPRKGRQGSECCQGCREEGRQEDRRRGQEEKGCSEEEEIFEVVRRFNASETGAFERGRPFCLGCSSGRRRAASLPCCCWLP